MTPHVKILILNWNGKELLTPCLDSVLDIDYPNYSVKIIDNKSTDGSISMVHKNYPDVEIMELDRNYGFAGGYNRCFTKIKEKPSEFIMLLNNDTLVDPMILHSFNTAREQYGDNHIYGGKIYYQSHPERIWYAGGKVNLKFGYVSHIGIRNIDGDEFSSLQNTDYITGCCLFTSTKVIKLLDGFDERFNFYGEDVDLCLRGKERDINCYYCPQVKLWHHISASIGGEFALSRLFKKEKNLLKLILNHLIIFQIPFALICNILLFIIELLYRLIIKNNTD